MDDLNQLCQICLETFNKNSQNKIPKLLPCCKHSICLECLEDIYKRNNNTIICPVCRTKLYQDPSTLKTNIRVFEGFLRCPNCQKDVTKTELYLHFGDKLNLKCSFCQNEDLPLDDFLPSYLKELENFIKDFSGKNSLITMIDDKIGNTIDNIFNEIKEIIIQELRENIIEEIKSKLSYDVRGDFNMFNNYLFDLKEKYNYLYSFASDDTNKKFNTNDIINAMNSYAQKSDEIRKESNKYLYINKFIQENPLFVLNENVTKNEIGNFLLKVIDATLSDHKKHYDFLTGIKIFDEEIIKKIEEVKSQAQYNININENFNNNFNGRHNNNPSNVFDNINNICDINNIDYGNREEDIRFTLIPNDNKDFKVEKNLDFSIKGKKMNDKENNNFVLDNNIEMENNKEDDKKIEENKIDEDGFISVKFEKKKNNLFE